MLRELVAELSDGHRITYVDAGVSDGPTVLLLLGTPACRMEAAGSLEAAAHVLGSGWPLRTVPGAADPRSPPTAWPTIR